MGMNKVITNQNQYTDDINHIISEASRVIVPLSPISVFAARNPWANLEQYTFENIAQWLKKVRDVDIYPTFNTFKQAYERNEIGDREIELKLQQWLKQINPSIDKNHVETYARKSLDLAHLTVLNRVSESQDIANHRTNALNKTDDMNTTSLVSTYITEKI